VGSTLRPVEATVGEKAARLSRRTEVDAARVEGVHAGGGETVLGAARMGIGNGEPVAAEQFVEQLDTGDTGEVVVAGAGTPDRRGVDFDAWSRGHGLILPWGRTGVERVEHRSHAIGIDAVRSLAPARFDRDETGFAQKREVGRDTRLRQTKVSAEFADRRVAAQQQVQETQTRLVGQGLCKARHGMEITHLKERINNCHSAVK
jgi:hypothetical protein